MKETEILEKIKAKDRQALAKTMTLLESFKEEDRKISSKILSQIEKDDYPTRVIGITGTPGVGKSTFLNSYAKVLAEEGKSVAILTIDPSSEKTGGSILGDKTRMADLIQYENVFIRPSASATLLGGVSAATRDLITLCEYFGFDYIFVETVGVGQSEVQLAKIVDFVLLFLAPGGGDDLQGMKKGILEFTDLLVINKSDIDKTLALQTAALYGQSLPRDPCVISSLKSEGLDKVREQITDLYSQADLSTLRNNKRKDFFWNRVEIEAHRRLSVFKTSDKAQDLLQSYLTGKRGLRETLKKILKKML